MIFHRSSLCSCVHFVIGEADVESLYGVAVRVPQGDDMGVAEACPELVEGKTFSGRLVSVMEHP